MYLKYDFSLKRMKTMKQNTKKTHTHIYLRNGVVEEALQRISMNFILYIL